MSDTRVVLVALKEIDYQFGNVNLLTLMRRALRVEERMKGMVLIEDEQRRYNTYCNRVEFYGHQLVSDGRVDTCDLGDGYLELVSLIASKYPEDSTSARLTANFWPKENVGSAIKQFEYLTKNAGVLSRSDVQAKLAFFRKAEYLECSVVELLQTWVIGTSVENESSDFESLKKSFLDLAVSDDITQGSTGGHFVALRDQIQRVVDLTNKKMPAAVNFSALRHDVIAEILHDFVFGKGRPMYVDVTYADGSEATRFPLYCLKKRNNSSQTALIKNPVLHLGMMSARHSNDGLDIIVDSYWFRNQEISIGRTQAETDEVAYKKSKELFELIRAEGPYKIYFYQTGFQPAVVGFYRALTEELILREKNPPSLEVTPYYFIGGKYKTGKVWR